MPDWDPSLVVSGTADAAFVSDASGLVVAWNEAAADLLGYAAPEVVGRPCHEILCGKDTFGNRYCDESCAVGAMAQRHEPARLFLLNVQHRSGSRLLLRVSVIQLPAPQPSDTWMVHLLTPAALPGLRTVWDTTAPAPASEGSDALSAPEAAKLRSLTAREVQVLRLLAGGHTSQDIANELFIGLTTVRTHTQNILRKLDVHSQLEAVAIAFKKRLV